MPARPHWNRRGYQHIAHVAWQAPELVVDFEDGSRARLEGQRLLLPDDGPVEWERLTWSLYEIAVPGPYEVVVIPWSRIRVLTDAGYAAYLASAAEDEAREIGARLRQLRKVRGLTGKEVAERAGIPPPRLSRIERGQHQGGLPALEPLLAAMDCTLHDLIATDETADDATEARGCAARR